MREYLTTDKLQENTMFKIEHNINIDSITTERNTTSGLVVKLFEWKVGIAVDETQQFLIPSIECVPQNPFSDPFWQCFVAIQFNLYADNQKKDVFPKKTSDIISVIFGNYFGGKCSYWPMNEFCNYATLKQGLPQGGNITIEAEVKFLGIYSYINEDRKLLNFEEQPEDLSEVVTIDSNGKTFYFNKRLLSIHSTNLTTRNEPQKMDPVKFGKLFTLMGPFETEISQENFLTVKKMAFLVGARALFYMCDRYPIDAQKMSVAKILDFCVMNKVHNLYYMGFASSRFLCKEQVLREVKEHIGHIGLLKTTGQILDVIHSNDYAKMKNPIKIILTDRLAFLGYNSRFFEDFEPIEFLGKGGFAIVVKAKSKLDQEKYAVKRVLVNEDPEIALREVKAMAKLVHPNIVRYHNAWLETPPRGWQRKKDNELKRKFRAWYDSESSGSTNDITSSGDVKATITITSEESSGGIVFESSKVYVEDEVMDVEGEVMDVEDEVMDVEGEVEDEESDSHENENAMERLNLEDQADAIENVTPSYLYIQMQLCQRTLRSWLDQNRSQENRSIDQMKSWFKQICSAVEYIHSKRLIHRDLKPQNIFIDDKETLKVGDLGLVRNTATSGATSIGPPSNADGKFTQNVGTDSYMSPEQLKKLDYTSKVDVFSIGLIYLELLYLFKTDTERITVFKKLQEGSVLDIFDELGSDEAQLLRRLTAYAPENRPTCQKILEDYFKDILDK